MIAHPNSRGPFVGFENRPKLKPREIISKKESLSALEMALKKRISELRELCLREGELTGQLPIDYPLQPREPIPQVRRRVRSNNNLSENISIIPPRQYNNNNNNNNPQHQFLAPSKSMPFPSRPTSTNSTSSSNSTASSNTRNLAYGDPNEPFDQLNLRGINYMQRPSVNQHCQPPAGIRPPSRPPRGSSLSQNRAANPVPATIDYKTSVINNQQSYHMRTESANGVDKINQVANNFNRPLQHSIDGIRNFQPYYEETKPFQMSDFYKYSLKHRQKMAECNDKLVGPQLSTALSDNKTTRQLQEDVSRKNNLLKFAQCDDQIQASVKLIEKSGQKLIEATAKAIASNPGLAEKLSNILPNHNGDRYQI